MNRPLFTSLALALAILIVGPAGRSAQAGDVVRIDQVGPGRRAAGSGDAEAALLRPAGTAGPVSWSTSDRRGNSGSFDLVDTATLGVLQAGDGNRLDVVATGPGGHMTLTQAGTGNMISAVQSGMGNTLGAVQTGGGNRLSVRQR